MQGLEKELNIVAKDLADAFKEMREGMVNLIKKLHEALFYTAKDTPKVNVKPLKKAFYNHSEYNCIKPNTKPYSAYKRLYRVQVR